MLLFIEDLAAINLKPFVATIFIAALALLIGALLLFLRETREAHRGAADPRDVPRVGAEALVAGRSRDQLWAPAA